MNTKGHEGTRRDTKEKTINSTTEDTEVAEI